MGGSRAEPLTYRVSTLTLGGARARWRRLRMRVRVHLVDYLGSTVLLLVRWWAMLRTAATSRTIADAQTLGTTLAALPGRNLG